MTIEKLVAEVLTAVEPVAEVMAEAAPALDTQQVADAMNFAGMIADDPEATQRYLDSLLRLLEIVQDPAVVEVMRVWSN